jgi:hypothetical protein
MDGVEIGIIWIPLRFPPFFLRKDFGRPNKDVVYVRHGSSTAIADPDEIVRMVEARSRAEDGRLRDRAWQEWSVIEKQALTSLGISFKHRECGSRHRAP